MEFFFIAEIAIIEIPKHAKETQMISNPISFVLYVENNFIYHTSKFITFYYIIWLLKCKKNCAILTFLEIIGYNILNFFS